MQKPKISIYDFTDCEGCQIKLIALKEKFLILGKRVDIVNWRLGQENNESGPFDISIIEGAPITQYEIDLLKKLRKESKVLIGLGSCATLGGIPGIIDKAQRKKWYKKIYGDNYRPRGVDALPLSAYVKVDFLIHGCPINENEVIQAMEDLLAGKEPKYCDYSVCFECKQANNPCRLLDNFPCLGPIIQGGCNAICISGGSPCYGCFGLREDAEKKNLIKILEKITDQKEIDRYFSMFLNKVNK
ncbi:MAG: hypothetical protein HQ537_01140 [Parcubacteria group bacterium]|nr:hypothetical protein [Parcubacteria group bacterium]